MGAFFSEPQDRDGISDQRDETHFSGPQDADAISDQTLGNPFSGPQDTDSISEVNNWVISVSGLQKICQSLGHVLGKHLDTWIKEYQYNVALKCTGSCKDGKKGKCSGCKQFADIIVEELALGSVDDNIWKFAEPAKLISPGKHEGASIAVAKLFAFKIGDADDLKAVQHYSDFDAAAVLAIPQRLRLFKDEKFKEFLDKVRQSSAYMHLGHLFFHLLWWHQ